MIWIDLYRQHLFLQTRHDYATKGIHSGGFKQETKHHLKSYDNSTMVGLLWHYLADSVQHTTFMRLPFVWLKFM